MSLILPAPWRRAIRASANAFPPATGDSGTGTGGGGDPAPSTFLNAPSGGGWTNLFEQDFAGLPRRWADPYYDYGDGYETRVYTQDMYLGDDPYDYVTYTGGVTTPWSASGSYLSIRFPPLHPGGYTNVKIQPDQAGMAPLGIDPTQCPTGEVYYGWYMRFRGSGGNPYTNSGNQQKLLYFSSTDAGNTTIHIVIGDDRTDGVGDLSLVTQFNPPSGGLFNNIRRGVSDDMGDGLWHLVEMRLKRNTYTAGTGNAQVSGTDLVFTNSQTGVVTAGTYITLAQGTFRVVSMSSGTNGVVEPSFSGTTGALPFDIVNQNGEFQLWLDGVQKASHTDVPLFLHPAGDNAVFDYFSFEPIYGGGSNPGPNWSLYIDMGRIKAVGR